MEKGQTLIEVLIALGVGIVILSSIVVVVILSLHNAQFARSQNLATSYSQEAMEVVRSIRNRSWTEFSALTATNYCLNKNVTTLSVRLPGQECPIIDAVFRRSVTIVWSGERATITVDVAWTDSQGPHSSKLVSYFTPWSQSGIAPPAPTPTPPPFTVILTANGSGGPITIDHNTSATLAWTTTGSPPFCDARDSWSGSKSTSGGSQPTGNLSGPGNYVFTLVCGSAFDAVTIQVNAPSSPCGQPGHKCIFLTSTEYDGNMGGLIGADFRCQARANAASLGGTWKAWMSDGTTPASSRLTHATVPYRLLTGTLIANNWADLVDGSRLPDQINVMETYGTLSGGVWTNTGAAGGVDGTNHCNNWTSNSSSFQGRRGGSGNTLSPNWTSRRNDNCDLPARLYCFEQ